MVFGIFLRNRLIGTGIHSQLVKKSSVKKKYLYFDRFRSARLSFRLKLGNDANVSDSNAALVHVTSSAMIHTQVDQWVHLLWYDPSIITV